MTREQAMSYRTDDGKPTMKDGKAMEFSAIDTDNDGRVSRSEWQAYQGASASGADTGSMTTGPGAAGSGTSPRGDGARSGSTPRATDPQRACTRTLSRFCARGRNARCANPHRHRRELRASVASATGGRGGWRRRRRSGGAGG